MAEEKGTTMQEIDDDIQHWAVDSSPDKAYQVPQHHEDCVHRHTTAPLLVPTGSLEWSKATIGLDVRTERDH